MARTPRVSNSQASTKARSACPRGLGTRKATDRRRACEIRLRAERKAGQLLRKLKKAKRGADKSSGQGSQRATSAATPTLADLRATKPKSSWWQQIAGLPETE